ncbi:MAG: threonine synthase [Prevotellaceae bacterium]|nr:threonine synthase [Prevotellaceae bacterium]
MKYFSTNGKAPLASLETAVVQGLAPDRGLYMPERINHVANPLADSLHETACRVAEAYFGEDIPLAELRAMVTDTLSFPIPLVKVKDNVYSLELFHGPTLAFKDVGARFMARMLRHFNRDEQVNVLVATSGDTGSAVANGFLGVEGIRVHVLYPKGKVSKTQEAQFTTLGRNITALEVSGTFDDCQALVKQAFMDDELKRSLRLTSANSINVARLLPQSFYYFHALSQLRRLTDKEAVVSVPSGNFGNLTSGLFGGRMGLPVKRFIAANNRNDVFLEYLRTGHYRPRPSLQTLANAMDVGDPSNFARILALYGNSHEAVTREISGASCTDEQISETMSQCFRETGYLLDPHGACAYRALCEGLCEGEAGVFLETAHPAKFLEVVSERVPEARVEVPERLQAFMRGRKQTVPMSSRYDDFREYLKQSLR